MRTFKVTDKAVKYENPWMRVVELKTETDGKKGIYGVVERQNSVIIILVTDNHEFLFVKQYRYPIDGYSFEFPMGGIDMDESIYDAATRELNEETKLNVPLQLIGEFRPVPGLTPQKAFVFLGKLNDDNKIKVLSLTHKEDEIVSYHVVPFKEIHQMVNSGNIIDGFTLSALGIYLLVNGENK